MTLETLMGAVPDVIGTVGTIFDAIASNSVLLFFAAIPIVGVGVGVLRKLVGASGSI